MKRFQSFEDFSESVKKEHVPAMDIDKLRARISEAPSSLKVSGARRKLSIVIAAILVLSVSTIAMAADTAIKKWQLMNSANEVVLEYNEKGKNEEFEQQRDAYKEYNQIAESIKSQLQKGEGALISTAEIFGMVEYEEYIKDLDTLKEISSVKFKAPAKLPQDYHFVDGRLSYEFSDYNAAEKSKELTKLAQSAPEGYAMEKFSLSPDVREVMLNYSNGTSKIIITIFESVRIDSYCTADYQTEVLKIGERDILHNWYQDKSTGTYFMVDEYDHGKWLHVITTTGSLTEDEVKHLINSFE